MAENSDLTQAERLMRKREAARIRQQRCRARKKAAEMSAKEQELVQTPKHQNKTYHAEYQDEYMAQYPPYQSTYEYSSYEHYYPETQPSPYMNEYYPYPPQQPYPPASYNHYSSPPPPGPGRPPSPRWHQHPDYIPHSYYDRPHGDQHYAMEEQENSAPRYHPQPSYETKTKEKHDQSFPSVEPMEIAAIDAMLSLGSSSSNDTDDGRLTEHVLPVGRPLDCMFTPIREMD